jgi:hypothetical protein
MGEARKALDYGFGEIWAQNTGSVNSKYTFMCDNQKRRFKTLKHQFACTSKR